jgi:hypothetical protein
MCQVWISHRIDEIRAVVKGLISNRWRNASITNGCLDVFGRPNSGLWETRLGVTAKSSPPSTFGT